VLDAAMLDAAIEFEDYFTFREEHLWFAICIKLKNIGSIKLKSVGLFSVGFRIKVLCMSRILTDYLFRFPST
jgi:hypothetical protein